MSSRAGPSNRPTRRDRIRADLERLGVRESARDELSRRLERLAERLSADAYDGALAGIVLAEGLHQENRSASESVRDAREVEHLLRGFAEEVRKLDEVMQTLSAYAKRLSACAPRAGRDLSTR